MYEPFEAKVNNSDLSPWYYAVGWAKHTLQLQITRYNGLGLNTSYEEKQLERLVELEQFLKMSWDQWMESLLLSETAKEVK
jgi:hypothetical protein